MRRTLIAAITLALAGIASGCTESTAPGGTGSSPGPVRSGITPIRQAPDAPPLASYAVQFTAVKGESKEIEVKYAGASGEPEDFLDIELHENSLLKWPDGTPIQDGESVAMSIVIDPETFLFTLRPAGLEFDPAWPLEIEIRYENADDDFDEDGDIDGEDDSIRTSLGTFREDLADQWTPLLTENDSASGTLRARSKRLDNIAVSW